MGRRTKADWTAEDLARQAEAASQLVEYLKSVDEDDDDLIEDSIEGETDFKETIERALDQIAEAEMMAEALAARIKKMAQRKKRFEDKGQFLRNCIAMAMAIANGDQGERPLPFTLTLPTATVTLRDGTASVIVEDEALLPSRFWRTPEPVIDKKALNEYMAARNDDPESGWTMPTGVKMTDPGFSLSIRRG